MLSVMEGTQQRFLDALAELDGYLTRKRSRQAERMLGVLDGMACGQRQPAIRRQMADIVAAQRTRLTDLKRQQQRERIEAAARHKRKKPNAVCALCGQPYRRGKKDKGTTSSICRPPGQSRSVRTVGGGLPTLGKRHR